MPDASRTTLGIVEENPTTPGTTPVNPVFELLRPTAINLSFSPKTKLSAELIADRNVADVVLVGKESGGDTPMECSYGAIDTVLRGGMMSDWIYTPVRDNNGTAASAITAVSGTQYTVAAAAGAPAFGLAVNVGSYVAGMLVYGTNFAIAGNNGLHLLTAATGTLLTAAGLAAEASPAAAARLKAVGYQGASGDITTTAGGSNSIGSTTIDFTTLPIVPGQWLKLGGTSAPAMSFATAGVNDFVRVLTVAAHSLVLDQVPAGWASDTGTGKTIQIFFGDIIRNGTTARSYTTETGYADLATPEFDYANGMRVGSFEFGAVAEDIATFKATYMGMNTSNVTARFTGATSKAAATGNVMSVGISAAEVRVNNALIMGGPNFVKEFTSGIDNTLRRQAGVGSLGSVGIGIGRAQCKGKVSMYYGGNTAARTALLTNTAASLSSILYDPNVGITGGSTSAYHLDIPKLKWTAGDPSVPGVDQDRMLDLDYQGIKCALGFTMQVGRFDYLPT